MKPIDHFEAVWERCSHLSAMQAFLAANVAGVLKPDELLRAEWVARVSALDLYIHELVAQMMLNIFETRRPTTQAYKAFMLASDTVDRIRHAPTSQEASAAFDLEVRRQLGIISYQQPEKIADGIRMCSSVELWNAIALHQGSSQQDKVAKAKLLKRQLTTIIDRRNKIAHEGDLQPNAIPITAWPICQADLVIVSDFIGKLVISIDICVE